MSWNSSANSPFRSRTTGASRRRRVSAGKASVASTIWLTLRSKAHVALRLHVLEQLGELALSVAYHRRQQEKTGLGRQGERRVDHLADAQIGSARSLATACPGTARRTRPFGRVPPAPAGEDGSRPARRASRRPSG